MKTQKVVNLLNDSDNESSRFTKSKWHIIKDQNKGKYGRGNENGSTIKFETKVIKPNVCNYSDSHIPLTGDIKFTDVTANTNVAFKNFAPFTSYVNI